MALSEPSGRIQAQVLLVDDDARLAEMLEGYLGAAGYRVQVAPNLASARQVLAAKSALPDAVILDLMLPGCSGLEVVEAIRADPETGATPVLMLTAKGQGRDREAAERAGVDRFMTKHFSNADMLASVRALVAR